MLVNRIAMFTMLIVGSINLCQAAEKLELDAKASKIDFVGKKSDGKHDGGFKKFTSDAVADFETPSNGSLTIEIDASSLWADDEKLANHLKNPDFFDVRKYPKINFKSTAITHGESEGQVTLKGQLTMLGKTVEVEIPCKGVVNDKSVELQAKFVIDRTRWGMTYGEGKVNKDVDINATLVFNR